MNGGMVRHWISPAHSTAIQVDYGSLSGLAKGGGGTHRLIYIQCNTLLFLFYL